MPNNNYSVCFFARKPIVRKKSNPNFVVSFENAWTQDNIEHRHEIITQEVMKLLNRWESQYHNYKVTKTDGLLLRS